MFVTRRELVRGLAALPFATVISFPGSASAQNVFGNAVSLGGSVGDLLGSDHTSAEISQAYFEQIIRNQEAVLQALQEVATSIETQADMLRLIPQQTVEIGQVLSADTMFVRASSLLADVIEARLKGEDPATGTYEARYRELLLDIDKSTAAYLSALNRLGQSHDLCASLRPLWNATQSVADCGSVMGLFGDPEKSLLRTGAKNVRSAAENVLTGTALLPGNGPKPAIFREYQAVAMAELRQAITAIQGYQNREVVNKDFYLVQASSDFYTAPAPGSVSGSTVNKISTRREPGQCQNMFDLDAGPSRYFPQCGQMFEIQERRSAPVSIGKTPLDPDRGASNNFAITVSPVREGADYLALIGNFNDAKSREFMFDNVERLLAKISAEALEKLGVWL